ncbi:hypothetical protein C8R45DRAFT_943575 [Mycena sanguinolenta]|nr:hypothetical protein C8R45DRAFT_943575 [Mycena sanguinolenta]
MQPLLNKSFLVFAAVLAVQLQAGLLLLLSAVPSTYRLISSQVTNALALGAYFCNDANWTNDCAHWTNLVAGTCYTLDGGHQNSISSFGPDLSVSCVTLVRGYNFGPEHAPTARLTSQLGSRKRRRGLVGPFY